MYIKIVSVWATAIWATNSGRNQLGHPGERYKLLECNIDIRRIQRSQCASNDRSRHSKSLFFHILQNKLCSDIEFVCHKRPLSPTTETVTWQELPVLHCKIVRSLQKNYPQWHSSPLRFDFAASMRRFFEDTYTTTMRRSLPQCGNMLWQREIKRSPVCELFDLNRRPLLRVYTVLQ